MRLSILSLLFSMAVLSAQTPQRTSPRDIIKKFTEKESEFLREWERYAYSQNVVFEILGEGRAVRERRELEIEVYFTSDGKRETKIVSDVGRLDSVTITPEDIQNAIGLQPFVLTTEDLPYYQIDFYDVERVDELETYVFDVAPRAMEPGKRYFKGRIWVDQLDLQIVMTRGKPVPETENNKFPTFETIREQIDGRFWFPTWTEADDILRFRSNRVHIHQLITYGDFKKFDVSSSVSYEVVTDDGKPKEPPPPR